MTRGFGVLPMLVLIFLFVGFVILLIRSPKSAAALIGVCVVLLAALFFVRSSGHLQPPLPAFQVAPQPKQVMEHSSIWSDSMEEQFAADLYPSQASALKAAAGRLAVEIGRAWPDPNASRATILFQGTNSQDTMTELKQTMESKSPGLHLSIEAEPRTVKAGEIGVTFSIDKQIQVQHSALDGSGGKIVARAFTSNGAIADTVSFVEEPWVKNFGLFASEPGHEHYIVARSNDTSIDENTARARATEDACWQVQQMILDHRSGGPGSFAMRNLDFADLQREGFIADTFVQSFDGSAGKIWRQAMLIDVSAAKLDRLSQQVTHEAQVQHLTWVKQIGSAVGVLALILATYFFLNMATRGYYEWSLRIAGLVLAIIAIVVFLG
jgi:hypothetical protein